MPQHEHKTVSREEWVEARKVLLRKEKEMRRARDAMAAERRALPWVRVDKPYVFDGPNGKVTLAQLFGKNGQLIVYHFMFAPDWQAGCPFCSFLADHIDAAEQHLRHHDVSVAVISRAPFEKLDAYRRRMGWKFTWVSAGNCAFNQDYGVSFTKEDIASGRPLSYNFAPRVTNEPGEAPGASVFFKDADGRIFHTYSTYARGGEELIGAYDFLDMVPLGRDETGPAHNLTDWVRRHDEYAKA